MKGNKKAIRLIIALFICCILLGLGIMAALSHFVRHTDSYELSISHIENNEKVTETVGEILEYGYFPSTSIRTQNGHSTATYKIKVMGSKEELFVKTYLEKSPDSEWELVDIEYLK